MAMRDERAEGRGELTAQKRVRFEACNNEAWAAWRERRHD